MSFNPDVSTIKLAAGVAGSCLLFAAIRLLHSYRKDSSIGSGFPFDDVETQEDKQKKSKLREMLKLKTSSIHHGNCHCGRNQFKIRGPVALNAIEVNSILRFPRVKLSHVDFELLSDPSLLTMYTSHAENETQGIYAFCSFCGTQIIFSPSNEQADIQVNLHCLDSSSIEHAEIGSFNSYDNYETSFDNGVKQKRPKQNYSPRQVSHNNQQMDLDIPLYDYHQGNSPGNMVYDYVIEENPRSLAEDDFMDQLSYGYGNVPTDLNSESPFMPNVPSNTPLQENSIVDVMQNLSTKIPGSVKITPVTPLDGDNESLTSHSVESELENLRPMLSHLNNHQRKYISTMLKGQQPMNSPDEYYYDDRPPSRSSLSSYRSIEHYQEPPQSEFTMYQNMKRHLYRHIDKARRESNVTPK